MIVLNTLLSCRFFTVNKQKCLIRDLTKENEIAVLITHTGSAALHFGGSTSRIKEGEFAVIPPSTEYEYAASYRKRSEMCLITLCISKMPDIPQKGCILSNCRLDEILRRAAFYLTKKENSPKLSFIADEIIHLLNETTSSLALNKVLDDLAFNIQRNPESKHDVAACAESLGLSADRFSQIFKKRFGFSPHRFQLLLRVEKIKYYLEHTSLNLSAISKLTGSGSAMQMSHLFLRYTGVTPSNYRKTFKKK